MKISFEGKKKALLEVTHEEYVTIVEALGETSEEEVEGSAELYTQMMDSMYKKVANDFARLFKESFGGEQ